MGFPTTALSFPADDSSVGGFKARLTFSNWAQSGAEAAQDALSASTGVFDAYKAEKLMAEYGFDIWLPYPQQISTGYAGQFEDKTEMKQIKRGEVQQSGMNIIQRMAHVKSGVSLEIANTIASVTAPNASTKMSQKSIINNNMGVQYNGTTLRTHNFTWKLQPKSDDEQKSLIEIISRIKYASLPQKEDIFINQEKLQRNIDKTKQIIAQANSNINKVVNSANGKDEGETQRAKWRQEIQDAKTQLEIYEDKNSANKLFQDITTLGIPNTVRIEFFMLNSSGGYATNPSLFKVGESFITDFQVNYTSSGMWSAHIDGSPIETQITMNLKEIQSVTHNQLEEGM